MIKGQREEVQHCRYGARRGPPPPVLEWRPRLLGRLSLPAGAVLVMLRGFLLRIVVILSSEGGHTRWHGAGTVVLLVFLVGLGAGTSQEASRARGGGLGSDMENRDVAVEMHAGTQPYYQTLCRLPMRCARCGAAWRTTLWICLYCNEMGLKCLGVLLPKQHGTIGQIDTCATCQGYLKTHPTLQVLPVYAVTLQDLATIALDVAALDRGYTRPERPGYALACRLVASPIRRHTIFGWHAGASRAGEPVVSTLRPADIWRQLLAILDAAEGCRSA